MSLRSLQDFMIYPDFAFKLAMIKPFDLSVNVKTQDEWSFRHLLQRVWFIYGATCLIYQNFGLVIYLSILISSPEGLQVDDTPLLGHISEMGAIMGLTLVGTCKMWILLRYRKKIIVMLKELQDMLPNEKTEDLHLYNIDYYGQESQFLMKYATMFFLFAFTFYNSLPIVVTLYQYFHEGHHFQLFYQSGTWYPWQRYGKSTSLVSSLAAYLCQMQSSLTGVAFIMAGEFMLCFFITQIRLHFDYLANSLESLNARSPRATQRLKCLIAYHNRVLCISKEINEIFNVSFMVNFATSSIAICLMGFSMVMISLAHACKYSVGLLSFLVFALFICYNGSQFTATSERLSPAAFNSNWYEGDMVYRKILMFFMMRTREPNTLMAYKFYTVSMQTFMMILKFSYQLFTFFQAMG